MAGSTRLELATSGVTGRRSNQLNYDPAMCRLAPSYHSRFGDRATRPRRCRLLTSDWARRSLGGQPSPGLPTEARPLSKASEDWWAVQDSNL